MNTLGCLSTSSAFSLIKFRSKNLFNLIGVRCLALTEPSKTDVAVVSFSGRAGCELVEDDLSSLKILAIASSCSITYKTRCSVGSLLSSGLKAVEESSRMRLWRVLRSFEVVCAGRWVVCA